MTSREKILAAVTSSKPALVPLPVVDSTTIIQYDDLLLQFKTVLESIGGTVIVIESLSVIREQIIKQTGEGCMVINTIKELNGIDSNLQYLSADVLAGVDFTYIKGSVAVAENGAVWLYESQMINRLLPFICQHLILVIDKENIVATMHQSYQQIDTDKEGFGVFIAGPSKTADIEQSLVIGAHGARSLIVYLL